jgi:hypothetical protein
MSKITAVSRAIRWAMDGYCIMAKEDRTELAARIEKELIKRKLTRKAATPPAKEKP